MIEGELREPMIETLDEVAVMADGLVSYARSGQSENLTQSVSLKDLLSKLCEELDVPFHATADPVITAGPVSFSRAIRNLVENALAYAGQAEIVLSAAKRAATETPAEPASASPSRATSSWPTAANSALQIIQIAA